jgi:hypothetical protein
VLDDTEYNSVIMNKWHLDYMYDLSGKENYATSMCLLLITRLKITLKQWLPKVVVSNLIDLVMELN